MVYCHKMEMHVMRKYGTGCVQCFSFFHDAGRTDAVQSRQRTDNYVFRGKTAEFTIRAADGSS